MQAAMCTDVKNVQVTWPYKGNWVFIPKAGKQEWLPVTGICLSLVTNTFSESKALQEGFVSLVISLTRNHIKLGSMWTIYPLNSKYTNEDMLNINFICRLKLLRMYFVGHSHSVSHHWVTVVLGHNLEMTNSLSPSDGNDLLILTITSIKPVLCTEVWRHSQTAAAVGYLQFLDSSHPPRSELDCYVVWKQRVYVVESLYAHWWKVCHSLYQNQSWNEKDQRLKSFIEHNRPTNTKIVIDRLFIFLAIHQLLGKHRNC